MRSTLLMLLMLVPCGHVSNLTFDSYLNRWILNSMSNGLLQTFIGAHATLTQLSNPLKPNYQAGIDNLF